MINKPSLLVTLAPLLLVTSAAALTEPAAQRSEQPEQHSERRQQRESGTERGQQGGPGRPGGQGRVSPLVAALDINKDGEISPEETANAAAALKALDKNSDGKLGPEELRPAPPPVIVPASDIVGRLMEFDRNNDGKLSLTELPARMKSLPKQSDTNKDGILTQKELTVFTENQETVRRQEAERREKIESERQKREGAPTPQPVPGGPGRPVPIIAALDLDKNGEVSADELARAADSLKTLDANNDGRLSPEELRPAPPPESGSGDSHAATPAVIQ